GVMDTGEGHVPVLLQVVVAFASQAYERGDRRRPGTPEPVRVVAADDAWQLEPDGVQLERSGLAVVADERDRRPPLALRDRLVHRGNVSRKLLPSVHVGEELREPGELLVLRAAR